MKDIFETCSSDSSILTTSEFKEAMREIACRFPDAANLSVRKVMLTAQEQLDGDVDFGAFMEVLEYIEENIGDFETSGDSDCGSDIEDHARFGV